MATRQARSPKAPSPSLITGKIFVFAGECWAPRWRARILRASNGRRGLTESNTKGPSIGASRWQMDGLQRSFVSAKAKLIYETASRVPLSQRKTMCSMDMLKAAGVQNRYFPAQIPSAGR